MANRLPLKKIETEKAEFIEYLKRYSSEPAISSKFPYKSFYENDPEVQKVRKEIANNTTGKHRDNNKVVSTIVMPSEKDRNKPVMTHGAKQHKKDIKRDKKIILNRLREMQKLFPTKKNEDILNITQELLGNCKLFLDRIPSEYKNATILLEIKSLKKKIIYAQSYVNIREYLIELFSLDTEENDAVFFEKISRLKHTIDSLPDIKRLMLIDKIDESFCSRIRNNLKKIETEFHDKLFDEKLGNVKQAIESYKLSESVKSIIISQLNATISRRDKKKYKQTYDAFYTYISKWLVKIEKSQESIQGRRIRLNDVDKEIRSRNFEKLDTVSLQRLVSNVRKRLTRLEQGILEEEPNEVLQKEQSSYTKESENILETPYELAISWSNIVFGNNVIRITDTNGKFLLAPKETCRKSYNQIKEYLADKLPQIILVKNQSGTWMLKEPIVFKNALSMIRRRESDNLLQEEQFRKALRNYSSVEDYLADEQNQDLVLKRLKEKKQTFLNYLIKHQITEYKLVPAIEMIAHQSNVNISEEDVFVFTIPYQSYKYGHIDCVNIIYENVNPARATIVCTIEKRHYYQALQSVYNFMNDEKQKNKRSRLHQTLKLNSYVKNLHTVNHTDMHTWAMAISR